MTGLIFVAVSINLQRILAFRALPRRVLKALGMLCLVLFVSTIGLVPGQPARALGFELLGVGLVGAAWVLLLDIGTWRITEQQYRRPLVLMPIGLLASVCAAIAGASLVAQAGGGLYWLVGMILLALVAALLDAWVLLIEIVR
ncbi:MAG: hypothetical protein JO352_04945 [Chloroflexi bacterium]|nr:hypothetical protein [Chloroflexota bacterium]MBV9600373.1 hypothetical protein [Chloroflexota bacterium]